MWDVAVPANHVYNPKRKQSSEDDHSTDILETIPYRNFTYNRQGYWAPSYDLIQQWKQLKQKVKITQPEAAAALWLQAMPRGLRPERSVF